MLIEEAVAAVLARVSDPPDTRPSLIGIDGLGGGGKTGLAAGIARARPDVQVIISAGGGCGRSRR